MVVVVVEGLFFFMSCVSLGISFLSTLLSTLCTLKVGSVDNEVCSLALITTPPNDLRDLIVLLSCCCYGSSISCVVIDISSELTNTCEEIISS